LGEETASVHLSCSLGVLGAGEVDPLLQPCSYSRIRDEFIDAGKHRRDALAEESTEKWKRRNSAASRKSVQKELTVKNTVYKRKKLLSLSIFGQRKKERKTRRKECIYTKF